eukprot:TRINITY_DN11574_c0_g2_i1.p1 TRINITY_DN11574_c0_g2~~TRINITY_DN11574_c0_g2_i1.p1  ORF type:complete len:537 (+),score=90.82 TRINITY_DN11574_c0_g2_i1:42-1652(+)
MLWWHSKYLVSLAEQEQEPTAAVPRASCMLSSLARTAISSHHTLTAQGGGQQRDTGRQTVSSRHPPTAAPLAAWDETESLESATQPPSSPRAASPIATLRASRAVSGGTGSRPTSASSRSSPRTSAFSASQSTRFVYTTTPSTPPPPEAPAAVVRRQEGEWSRPIALPSAALHPSVGSNCVFPAPEPVQAQPQNIMACPSNGTVRHLHSHTCTFTGHSQCGFLFDVTAKQNDIAVTAVVFIPGTKDGDYDIWTTRENHERVHQNAKAWTLVAKGSHTGPRGAKLRVPLQRHVKIPSGERHAFYISGHNVNAVCFSTESYHSNSAEDEDLVVHLGHFKAFPWEGVLSTGPFGHNGMQEFVGALEYQVLQPPAADYVVSAVKKIWETRPFPDAELVASDGSTFSVHRSVLAAASLHLEEAWGSHPPTVCGVPQLTVDAPSKTVEALLKFMYTGDEGDTEEPGEMLRLAHLYGLQTLVRGSAIRLATTLSRENAVTSVRALRPYRDNPACEAAWQMLMANVQSLLVGDGRVLEEVLLSV